MECLSTYSVMFSCLNSVKINKFVALPSTRQDKYIVHTDEYAKVSRSVCASIFQTPAPLWLLLLFWRSWDHSRHICQHDSVGNTSVKHGLHGKLSILNRATHGMAVQQPTQTKVGRTGSAHKEYLPLQKWDHQGRQINLHYRQRFWPESLMKTETSPE